MNWLLKEINFIFILKFPILFSQVHFEEKLIK